VTRSAVALLVVFGACSAFSVDQRERDLRDLDTHRDRWRADAIHDYVLEYSRSCFCPPEITKRARIEVRGDNVVKVTDVQTGADLTNIPYASWPTIDSLFASARRIIADAGWKYEIAYDPTFAYISRFSGDIPNAIDDEFVQTVYAFSRTP
jgi:hypothetical protein